MNKSPKSASQFVKVKASYTGKCFDRVDKDGNPYKLYLYALNDTPEKMKVYIDIKNKQGKLELCSVTQRPLFFSKKSGGHNVVLSINTYNDWVEIDNTAQVVTDLIIEKANALTSQIRDKDALKTFNTNLGNDLFARMIAEVNASTNFETPEEDANDDDTPLGNLS